MTKLDIVERITSILDEKGVTAYEIAKYTELSEVGVNRIRNGKSKNPNDRTLNAICDYLENRYGVNRQWLMTGKGIRIFPEIPKDDDYMGLHLTDKEAKLDELATFIAHHEEEMMANAIFRNVVERLAYKIVIDTMGPKIDEKGA